MTQLILYTSEDGQSQVQLRADRGTVWLTQLEMAELFNASKQNISLHLKNIYQDGELDSAATVKESLTVQTEGAREVRRSVTLYNLDAILAVGYRVRSPRGVQFRRWASTVLAERRRNRYPQPSGGGLSGNRRIARQTANHHQHGVLARERRADHRRQRFSLAGGCRASQPCPHGAADCPAVSGLRPAPQSPGGASGGRAGRGRANGAGKQDQGAQRPTSKKLATGLQACRSNVFWKGFASPPKTVA